MRPLRVALLACAAIGGVSLTSPLVEDAPEVAAAPETAPQPEFEALRGGGTLRIQGHTISAAHEQRLRDLAKEHYAELRIESRFAPLGPAPGHWVSSTERALLALKAANFASASLDRNRLTLRGVTSDAEAWQIQLAMLREGLSPDVTLRDERIAAADSPEDVLCARAYAGFRHQPIQFVESTADFRPSAIPVLQRVAALADACRRAVVQITGHTDSSGDETANIALSKWRADAVANHLASLGIIVDRMEVTGVGSSQPVASNRTRYGRSLNRRIDIRFRQQ